MSTPTKPTSNAVSDPTQSLQTFTLKVLDKFTKERSIRTQPARTFNCSTWDAKDVHNILKYVLSRVRVSRYVNMFGYDDDELNDILVQ